VTDAHWLAAVVTDDSKRKTALKHVNGCDVRFQLDSGADVNTICHEFVKKPQARPTSHKLIMWNKSKFTQLGRATLKNYKSAQVTVADFIIVPHDFSCL